MFIKIYYSLLFLVVVSCIVLSNSDKYVGHASVRAYPCNNTKIILEVFERNQPLDDVNKYILFIDLFKYKNGNKITENSNIVLTFDSKTRLTLDTKIGRISIIEQNKYSIRVHEEKGDWIRMTVRGDEYKLLPNILSVKINGDELCPSGVRTGIWDDYIVTTDVISIRSSGGDYDVCGSRSLKFKNRIKTESKTEPGDWPWHAAFYKTNNAQQNYICGGTLLNPSSVITAGHCITEHGAKIIPSRLFVILGKYNLMSGDMEAQERSVHEIFLHPDFKPDLASNDIAIVKLSSEVKYTDYIKPICLWNNDIEKSHIYDRMGIIVGWGFTYKQVLSMQMMSVNIPVVSDDTCLQSYPNFFKKHLTDYTYCAGFRNGTGVCNGDSGGGMYFSEEQNGDTVWFLRGIVSLTVSRTNVRLCDPNHYTIFTDVARYIDWIHSKL